MGEEDAVWANFTIAIPLAVILFLVYCWLRTKMTRFYHRNVLVAGHYLLTRIPTGFFAWLGWIVRIPEGQYLALTGLDAYSAVSAFNLLTVLTACYAVLGVCILAPYYYWHSDRSTWSFSSFSITVLYEPTYWLPLTVQLALSALTLYLLYHFCCSFVPLRQAFLMQPSCMTGLGRLALVADAFGSFNKGRSALLDSGTKTVLIHPIPHTIGVRQIERILEEAGVKGVARVQRVGRGKAVKEALRRRNRTLHKLEACLKSIYEGLKKQHASKHASNQASKQTATAIEDKQTETPSTNNSSTQPQPQQPPSIQETACLLQQLLSNETFLKDLRPRHRTSKPAKASVVAADGSVDSICHFYAKLIEREEALQATIQHYDSIQEQEEDEEDEPLKTTETNDSSKELFPEGKQHAKSLAESTEMTTSQDDERFLEETAFISVKKLLSFEHLATFDKSKQWAALIHFDTADDANRTQQLLLSAQLNEMIPRPAPSPATIIAVNLNTTAWERFKGAVLANFLYFLLVISFAPVTTLLAQFMQLEEPAKWFPRIEEFAKQNPQLIACIEGVVAPYAVLRLTKTMPAVIDKILALRRPESKIESQRLFQRYTLFFFFFQMLLISAYFSSTYQIYATIATGQGFFGLLQYLREIAPSKAHFFANFFILQAAIECMMELVNPYSMLLQRGTLLSCYRKRASVRALLKADAEPLEGSIALLFSRFIVYPFFVVSVYAVICPLVLVPAVIYFSLASLVFKQRLLYMSRGPVESGGEFWRQACPQIINAVLLGQLSLLIQMGIYRRGYVAMFTLLFAALGTQFWVKGFFERTFGGKAWKTGSMVASEREAIAKIVQKYVQEQEREEFVTQMITGMHTGPMAASELLATTVARNDIKSTKSDYSKASASASTNSKHDSSEKDSKTSFIDSQVVEPYWYLCPLEPLLTSGEAATFDPDHVDHLIDVHWAGRPYSHPEILKHSQVLMMPRNLPTLLLAESNKSSNSQAK